MGPQRPARIYINGSARKLGSVICLQGAGFESENLERGTRSPRVDGSSQASQDFYKWINPKINNNIDNNI
jgi:hypothetical protein